MPLYEYKCRACGEVFELLQRFSDPPPAGCRSCSGPVDKLVSQSAFQLKGSGWYVTDYARKSAPAGKDEATGNKAAEPAGDGKAAEPKPGEAKAAEAKPAASTIAEPATKPAAAAS